jgi:GTP-binding protein
MVVGENPAQAGPARQPHQGQAAHQLPPAGKDKTVVFAPPRALLPQRAIGTSSPTKYVEATPHHIRLRKRILDPNDRKRAR